MPDDWIDDLRRTFRHYRWFQADEEILLSRTHEIGDYIAEIHHITKE